MWGRHQLQYQTLQTLPFQSRISIEDQLDTMSNIVHDAFGVIRNGGEPRGPAMELEARPVDESSNEFLRILNEGKESLHDRTTFSKLSFLMRFYHIKYLYHISDKAMNMILELLRKHLT